MIRTPVPILVVVGCVTVAGCKFPDLPAVEDDAAGDAANDDASDAPPDDAPTADTPIDATPCTLRMVYWSGLGGDDEIYIANYDGSGPVALTTNTAGDFQPKVSPDGTKIVFVSNRDGNNELGCGSIVTGLDGSNLDHLTSLSRGRSRGSGLGAAPLA